MGTTRNQKQSSVNLQYRMGSDEQYLSPEAIFSLNRVLYEIIDTLQVETVLRGDTTEVNGEKNFWPVPMLFNKKHRSWHFACVMDRWGIPDTDNEAILKGIRGALRDFKLKKEVFEKFKDNLLKNEDYQKSYENLTIQLDQDLSDNPDDLQGLLRDLLLIYHGAKLHRRLYLPGIYYRKCADKKIGWYEGRMPDNNKEVECTFYSLKGKRIGGNQKLNQYEDEVGGKTLGINPEGVDSFGSSIGVTLANLFYGEVLKKSLEEEAGDNLGNHPFLVLPIHDTWLGKQGFGGLWGCLILTFRSAELLEKFKENILPQFKDSCEFFSDELSESALATIANEKIIPPHDLIEHFLRTIIYLQDWERVRVYKKVGDEAPAYCYRRELEDDNLNHYEWKACFPNKSKDPKSSKKDKCLKCAGTWKTEHLIWNSDVDIWRNELIPELTDEEIFRFGSTCLVFEYPRRAVLPERKPFSEKNDTRRLFGLKLLKQQIDVLRILIPRVRARRSALRNAVVSIMGRNMSHNIGSHVLARYSSFDEDDVMDFFRYLQERMDFIADVSTTDVFYSLPLKFRQDAMIGLVGDGDMQNGQKILLQHISGLADVGVSINMADQNGQDYTYDSPGGRLGMHALYVILENIARNTAKNGITDQSSVQLKIMVIQSSNEKFLEVRVWDTCGNANHQKNNKSLVAWINEILATPMIKDSGEINPDNWGVREMYLAAAYLRSISPEELEARIPDNERYSPPVLTAVAVDMVGKITNKHNKIDNLSYRFYLKKNQLVIEVGRNGESKLEDAPSQGVIVFKNQSLKEYKRRINSSYSYGIFPEREELNEEEILKLPIRKFVTEEIDHFASTGRNKIEEKLSSMWLEKQLYERAENSVKYQMVYCPEDPNKSSKFLNCFAEQKISGLLESNVDNLIVFDEHETLYKILKNNNKLNLLGKLAFYEQFGSSSPQNNLIYAKKVNEKIYKCLFQNAALSRIILLDERIQEILKTQHKVMSFGQIFPLMGIFVPDKTDVDLDMVKCNKDNFFSYLEKLKETSNHRRKKDKIYDFLVIHQAIIDKLRDVTKDFDTIFHKVSRELGCDERIIVCSGRGNPRGNLPSYARFVHISSILEWTKNRLSKFHLVHLLNHSRRP